METRKGPLKTRGRPGETHGSPWKHMRVHGCPNVAIVTMDIHGRFMGYPFPENYNPWDFMSIQI